MVKAGKYRTERKKNQDLLELAVNCKFITGQQKKEILPRALAYCTQKPRNSIARFLLKNNILSKDKVELLFAIRNHIETLMADKKFGKLGIANEFVSRENVEKALDLQVSLFRKMKKSIKIGDILVNNNEISKADKTAILLTQNRVRDEFLAEAFNTIANSEIERIAINQRFGAIAVKKELISKEELNQALKAQKKELKTKGSQRYLGEILKELFHISDNEIHEVLKIQKIFETKRMNLQKKLAEYNNERISKNITDSDSASGLGEKPDLDKKTTPVNACKDAVHSVKKIKEDIITDTKDTYASCILQVKGNISPEANLLCHHLIIDGDILGKVTTTGDIEVKGNIGRSCEKNDNSCDPVEVSSKGQISVYRNIINAKIFAEKGLVASNADLDSSQVSSFQNIIVKNIFSRPEKPSILKIERKDFFKIEKVNQAIKEKTNELNMLLYKDEHKHLTSELLEQVQIQNGYMEKQNVIQYLSIILDDAEEKDGKSIVQKIKSHEGKSKASLKKENSLSIPENTKAYKFMEKIIRKIEGLDETDQKKYIKELFNNIARMYEKAVKKTEEMNDKYEAGSKSIDAAIEKAEEEITQKEIEIKNLNEQRDLLLLNREKVSRSKPVIKVKNEVQQYTIIQGETSSRKIDKSIYGVSIKEDEQASNDKTRIVVEGYFE